MKNLKIYKQRRKALMSCCPTGVMVLPAAQDKMKNGHHEYRFRQNSNFWYLTGFNEADGILVLTPGGKKYKSTLFLNPKDPKMEQWTGRRLGVENAPKFLGVDQAFDICDFDREILPLITGAHSLWMDSQEFFPQFSNLVKLIDNKRVSFRSDQLPTSFNHINEILAPFRMQKDSLEISLMRESQRITEKGHRSAMALGSAGVLENEIQAVMEYQFKKYGARGEAYTSIMAGGDNANILHYINNDQKLCAGELVLMDAGCEFDYYAADISRTFPVDGKFTTPQREIYELVLRAQEKCIKLCRPGATLGKIHASAIDTLVEGMLELGILKGDKKKIIENELYKKYYPHGTGHWLGLETHDIGPFHPKSEESLTKFREGVTFTVEPGLYLPADDSKVPKKYRGIGVRIEDNILITAKGHENLSANIPKSVEEVEAACAVDPAIFF